jgi:hypothetical protein
METMIKLTGLHLLLTYQCTFECDHCFVWGSPWQEGTMTAEIISKIIDQARDVHSIEWIYFEGGEPFLYYPLLMYGIDYAKKHGYKVGIVTNGYWANDTLDALLWMKPFEGKIDDLSISSDLFHYNEKISAQSQNILKVCETLNIPVGIISISQIDQDDSNGSLMYRGRAADKLAAKHENISVDRFTECPYEDFSDPGRFHVDPLGYLHVCQGIIAGNVYDKPLADIFSSYDPEYHPIINHLMQGGPLKLAQTYHIPTRKFYADACQLCYETRNAIRVENSQFLQPDQMYGIYG